MCLELREPEEWRKQLKGRFLVSETNIECPNKCCDMDVIISDRMDYSNGYFYEDYKLECPVCSCGWFINE